jgi:predicted MPP superfamily phosphohydrolase
MENNSDFDKAFSYFNEDNHNSNIYTIAMFHEPDLTTDFISSHNADLLLAGHSHNGNVRVPFLNFSPFKTAGAVKYDQDFYQIGDASLYISSGLGTPNGIRLFCRPSINFYRLSKR